MSITRFWPNYLCWDFPLCCLVLFLHLRVVLPLVEWYTIMCFWFRSWSMILTTVLGEIMWCWNLTWQRLMIGCHGLSLFRYCGVFDFRSGGFLWFNEPSLVVSSQCWWMELAMIFSSLKEVSGRAILFPHVYLSLLLSFYLEI